MGVAEFRHATHEVNRCSGSGNCKNCRVRSGQFLQYIVDQAIAGHFESLKERAIGVELFGRSPSYGTGDDAIVRVTASDVRKRLQQHYRIYGASSKFRVTLPLGSYIPEITRGRIVLLEAQQEPAATANGSVVVHRDPASVPREPVMIPASHLETVPLKSHSGRQWLSLGILLVALNLALWGVFWIRSSRTKAAPISALPWSALLNPSHATHLITSDPNIVEVQGITGDQISLSDYANRNYIPEPNKLTPEAIRFCHLILWGDNSAAAVDTPIAAQLQLRIRRAGDSDQG
jgi:hypothetical protein